MRRLIVLIAAVFALGAAPAGRPQKVDGYKGEDAGRMIVSLVEGGDGFSLVLLMRKLDENGEPDPRYRPIRAILGKPDFSGSPDRSAQSDHSVTRMYNPRTYGAIVVKRLPPGRYELYNFEAINSEGYSTLTCGLIEDVSVPFQIKPGRTTYLGEFKSIAFTAKNVLGMKIKVCVRMEVGDRSDRDYGFALRKDRNAVNPEKQILDVGRLQNPLLYPAGRPVAAPFDP